MKQTMLCTLALGAVLLFSSGTAQAITGLGFGLRAGTMNLDDPNTGESVDGMTMFGAHLKIGTLPIIDLEASLEYAQKKYDFSYTLSSDYYVYHSDGPENWPERGKVSAEVTYRHISLTGSAKYNFSPPMSPIKPYVGAGLGMHFIGSTVDVPGLETPVPLDLDTDFTESKTGVHGLAGLNLSFPLFPLEFFAEGRYGVIFTEDESTEATSLYAGLTLKLP